MNNGVRRSLRNLVFTALPVAGFAVLFGSLTSPAWALRAVPEIDPGSATSALSLLVGGALLLTHRLRSRS